MQATETDQQYWDRVLRDSYTEHVASILQEQEAIAKTLGKGKRVRKQINYLEKELGRSGITSMDEKVRQQGLDCHSQLHFIKLNGSLGSE